MVAVVKVKILQNKLANVEAKAFVDLLDNTLYRDRDADTWLDTG